MNGKVASLLKCGHSNKQYKVFCYIEQYPLILNSSSNSILMEVAFSAICGTYNFVWENTCAIIKKQNSTSFINCLVGP